MHKNITEKKKKDKIEPARYTVELLYCKSKISKSRGRKTAF
jgi:hypothetical protein